MTGPECPWCEDTGWITSVGMDGYASDFPCPEGCPMPELPPVQDQDAPR